MKRWALGAAALSALGAAALPAQRPSDIAAAGLQAYRALQYDRAATLFRESLAGAGPAALDDSARAVILVYLGAAHLFRGRDDSAAAAFRSALATNPRSRPDSLIFPPNVSTAFEQARAGTGYVAIVVPADTVVPAEGAYQIRLYGSAPHRALVRIDVDGSGPRQLFAGVIGDSALLAWPARDSLGARLPAGSATLEVTSRPASGAPRVVRLQLELGSVAIDTSALPSRPPDPTPAAPPPVKPAPLRFGSLAAGVVPGAAVILLPNLLSIGGGANGVRFAVGGALGVAGVIGLLSGRTQAAPPPVVSRGPSSAIAAWKRAVDSVHVENERRTRSAPLRIRKVAEPPPVR